jgi:hypothetical protein
MKVGHALVALGSLLFVLSIATLSRARVPQRSGPNPSLLLRAAWAVACVPYAGSQRTAPRSAAGAFACRD